MKENLRHHVSPHEICTLPQTRFPSSVLLQHTCRPTVRNSTTNAPSTPGQSQTWVSRERDSSRAPPATGQAWPQNLSRCFQSLCLREAFPSSSQAGPGHPTTAAPHENRGFSAGPGPASPAHRVPLGGASCWRKGLVLGKRWGGSRVNWETAQGVAETPVGVKDAGDTRKLFHLCSTMLLLKQIGPQLYTGATRQCVGVFLTHDHKS